MIRTANMITSHANSLKTALANKDLNQACVILTKIFRGVTTGEAIELLAVLKGNGVDDPLLNECFTSVGNMILKGTRPNSVDATMRISNIMEILHYDNGLPLTGYNYPKDKPTQWNDFFTHYDRDQDLWGFYWDTGIYNFATDGRGLFMRVNWTVSELIDYLTEAYDGASWEHDFNPKYNY